MLNGGPGAAGKEQGPLELCAPRTARSPSVSHLPSRARTHTCPAGAQLKFEAGGVSEQGPDHAREEGEQAAVWRAHGRGVPGQARPGGQGAPVASAHAEVDSP